MEHHDHDLRLALVLRDIREELTGVRLRQSELESRIKTLTAELERGFKLMSAQLDALTAQVHNIETVADSAITLLNGLSAQIAALKDDPAALQGLADELSAKSSELAAAVEANTPSVEP